MNNEAMTDSELNFIFKGIDTISKEEKREIFKKRYFINNCLLLLNRAKKDIELETLQTYNKKYDAITTIYKIKIWTKKKVPIGYCKRKMQNICEQQTFYNLDSTLDYLNGLINAYNIARNGLQTNPSIFATDLKNMLNDAFITKCGITYEGAKRQIKNKKD